MLDPKIQKLLERVDAKVRRVLGMTDEYNGIESSAIRRKPRLRFRKNRHNILSSKKDPLFCCGSSDTILSSDIDDTSAILSDLEAIASDDKYDTVEATDLNTATLDFGKRYRSSSNYARRTREDHQRPIGKVDPKTGHRTYTARDVESRENLEKTLERDAQRKRENEEIVRARGERLRSKSVNRMSKQHRADLFSVLKPHTDVEDRNPEYTSSVRSKRNSAEYRRLFENEADKVLKRVYTDMDPETRMQIIKDFADSRMRLSAK